MCTTPATEPTSDCGDGEDPGLQDECCHYANTCADNYACVGVYEWEVDYILACAYVCDPTGTIGSPTCDDGPGPEPDYHCVAFTDFWFLQGVPPWYGFCLSSERWGPAQCWNKVADGNEDGVDCCDPDSLECPCTIDC